MNEAIQSMYSSTYNYLSQVLVARSDVSTQFLLQRSPSGTQSFF